MGRRLERKAKRGDNLNRVDGWGGHQSRRLMESLFFSFPLLSNSNNDDDDDDDDKK